MKMRLAEREDAASRLLGDVGVMVSRPGEGHPDSDVFDCWGVCVGSHGGYAKTLKAAMRRCLHCCGIGEWWRAESGKGPLLRTVFRRIAKQHLGGL